MDERDQYGTSGAKAPFQRSDDPTAEAVGVTKHVELDSSSEGVGLSKRAEFDFSSDATGLSEDESKASSDPEAVGPRELNDSAQSVEPAARSAGWRQMLRSTHVHTARSAAVLLGASSLLSGLMGLVRTKYIAYVFGASLQTDAYQAAFELPDMIAYFLVGSVASITLVSMLSRFRKEQDEAGENLAISVVLNAMLVVLSIGIVLAEIFAPLYTRYKFPAFTIEQAALCTSLTRLLLPAQLCFFAGGVLGSRLLVRRIFLYQAITPLIYNLGIILGGVFLSRTFGIYSLAYGVLAGVFVGPFALSALGAAQSGMRYVPIFNLRHPLFREWLRLSLPLMIGISLVTADKWILTYFASADLGGITRLNMAKTLFMAPLGVLGQAAGAASLPFFAALHAQGKVAEFSASVDRAVMRVAAVSLLLASYLVVCAGPLVALLFRGGSFHQKDAAETAQYFGIFAISLALWAAQAIYARAFYAAGNTLTPAIAGTVITVASIPVYGFFFHYYGMLGLAWASNVGILTQVSVLAVLLHTKRLVSIAELDWKELGRVLISALSTGFVVFAGLYLLPPATGKIGSLLTLSAAFVAWGVVGFAVLRGMGSSLPTDLLRRRLSTR